MIKSLFKTTTVKNSIIIFVGNIVSAGLGFLVVVLLTRSFSTVEYGLFVTALAFVQTAAEILELGIRPAVFNFIPNANEERDIYKKATFLFTFAIALISALVIYIFSNKFAYLFFQDGQLGEFLKISSLGVCLMMFVYWGQAIFQAQYEFLNSSIATSLINVSRFAAILLLIYLGSLDALSAYRWLQIVLVVPVIFIFLNLNLGFLKDKVTYGKVKRILTFAIPAGLSYSLLALYTRLDQFFVFTLRGKEAAGIYGLAFQLSSFILFASVAVTSAITPGFSNLKGKEFKKYFDKTLLFIGGLSILSLSGIPLGSVFIPLIFGNKFEGSILPFQVLVLATIMNILSVPFTVAVMYQLKRPKFCLFVSALSLVVLWMSLMKLIPLFGVVGAAEGVLIMYIVSFLFYALYFFNFRKTINSDLMD